MPGSGSQSTTTSTAPWSGMRPYLVGREARGRRPAITGIMPEAERLYNLGPDQYFPDPTVAGFSPDQLAAQAAIRARATGGSPLNRSAAEYVQRTLGGGYTDAYLAGTGGENLFNSLDARLRPATAAQFALAGRGGSPAHARAYAEGMTNAWAPYATQLYGQERGLQQNAVPLAMQLAGQDYIDASALAGIGGQQQAQSQAEIDAAKARFDFGQTADDEALRRYAAMIQGMPYATQTQTSSGPGTLQTILGAGLGLGGILATPWTGSIGAGMAGWF